MLWKTNEFGAVLILVLDYTSPMDMPPLGQMAKSHFDGVVAKTTIYLDDEKIVDNGTVCHPSLKALADEILAQYS